MNIFAVIQIMHTHFNYYFVGNNRDLENYIFHDSGRLYGGVHSFYTLE